MHVALRLAICFLKMVLRRTKWWSLTYLLVTSLFCAIYVTILGYVTETVADEWVTDRPYITHDRLLELENEIMLMGLKTRPAIVNNVITNPAYFRYIDHGHSDICKHGQFSLFIYVHSAAIHSDRRLALRETWANRETLSSFKIGLLFFVGKVVKNRNLSLRLKEEIELYNDIVETEYVDVYSNISLKAASALSWVAVNCAPYVPYLLKLDDDIFVDIERLTRYITDTIKPLQTDNRRRIFCESSDINIVHREPGNRWYIPQSFYTKEFFPPFCAGLAYILTSEAVRTLHVSLINSRLFPLDDVWLTVLVNQGTGIELVPINYLYSEFADHAIERSHQHLEFVFAHCSVSNLRLFWHWLKCSKYRETYNLQKAHIYALL